MKIAGIEIPKHLEFGNEDHIKIARTVEKRLDLLDNGIKCPFCEIRMRTIEQSIDYENQRIKWQCDYCGDSFHTNLEGE